MRRHFPICGCADENRHLPPFTPRNSIPLGNWIRKTRLDRELTQEEVSVIFGVTECCVTNWELGHSAPEIRYYPRIIEFIGYCPYVPTTDLVERVKAVRQALGMNQEQLAKLLNVDESELASWERREHKPIRKSQHTLMSFLEMAAGNLVAVELSSSSH